MKDWKKPVRDLILHVDSLPRTSVWTRSQFRTFLSSWCIDDIPNGPVTPKGYPIHGIFTKENKKPTRTQVERLLDGLYPIVFESRSATQQSRIYRSMDVMSTVLEPRIQIAPDRVVQIGTSFWRYGESTPYRHTMITLGPCSDMDQVDLYPCSTERDLLLQW